MARWSGAEKSRHAMQVMALEVFAKWSPLLTEAGRGLVPFIAERSGREAIGTAGGRDVASSSSDLILVTGRPFGNGGKLLLLIPRDKAERLILSRVAGGRARDVLGVGLDWQVMLVVWSVCLRAGSRGGKEGRGDSTSSGTAS